MRPPIAVVGVLLVLLVVPLVAATGAGWQAPPGEGTGADPADPPGPAGSADSVDDPGFLAGRDRTGGDFPLVAVLALGGVGLLGLVAVAARMARAAD